MRFILAIGVLLMAVPAPAAAQGADAAVAFPQVNGIPAPLQSISGRFSSLSPRDRRTCSEKTINGRVVTPRLVLVTELACGRDGHQNALVNIQFANPADSAQMIAGRAVTIAATFKRAEEDREPTIVAEFLIAERARIVAAEPASAPTPPVTSYMVCQPPELDALARKVGGELCVQSSLVGDAASLAALETAARTPSNAGPEDVVAGDPNAISCRRDPKLSDQSLAATACARNSYWAWYKALHDPQFMAPAPALNCHEPARISARPCDA